MTMEETQISSNNNNNMEEEGNKVSQSIIIEMEDEIREKEVKKLDDGSSNDVAVPTIKITCPSSISEPIMVTTTSAVMQDYDDEEANNNNHSDENNSSSSPTPTTSDVVVAPTVVPVAVGREIEPEIIVDDLEYQDVRLQEYIQSRPAFISVTVIKNTINDRLGIALREVNGELEIFSISSDGLLGCGNGNDANDGCHIHHETVSPLRPGDKLMSINNFRCSTWDPHKAIQKLKDIVGSLTIIVQHTQGNPNLVAAMVVKPTIESKVGIGFGKMTHQEYLAVGSINPDGYFANSVLNIGDRIVSINGSPCQNLEPDNAVTVVRSSPKFVTFVALRQYMTGVVVSRHSFRSTTSSIKTTSTFYRPRLVSAIDHGSNKSFAMYIVLIVIAFCASAFWAINRVEQTKTI